MFSIYSQFGTEIDTKKVERNEQVLAEKYIQPDDCVLELGGRYGIVSCVINSKLALKTNHVVVEPDERVWAALEKNRDSNGCNFQIIKGLISTTPFVLTNLEKANGFATSCKPADHSSIPHFSLEEVKEQCQIQTFNVLFADCEGCLGHFLKENPGILDSLRLFIFECDYKDVCDYAAIRNMLGEKGFRSLQSGFHEVWVNERKIEGPALPT